MKLPVNRFKAGLGGARPLAGSWIMTGSANAAEAMACTGLDFIIVDMEHTDAALGDVIAMLRAIDGAGCEAVVRPPSVDPVSIRRLLDAGARTIMVPFVETAAQARDIVSATRYPPRGTRGLALMHRGSRYNQIPDYATTADGEICIIAQIETQTGIENTEAIAAVDGIDALFYGPGDLSCVVGEIGNTTGTAVRELIAREVRRCRDLGIASGTLVPDLASAEWAKSQPFDFISVGNDFGMIVRASREIAADLGAGQP